MFISHERARGESACKHMVEGWISKWQAGFKSMRGYVDNIVVLLWLLRRGAAAGKRIFGFKTDIDKAFDSVYHEDVFESLRQAGASRKSIALVRDMYAKAKAIIMEGRARGEAFVIGRGVLQGDILLTGARNTSP